MGTVISITTAINITKLCEERRRLSVTASIAPARNDTERLDVTEHSGEPIKKLEDIERICDYLLSNGQYRDYMLFVLGINFGLRVSDLLRLRFCDLINEDFTFKESFNILEKKTSQTRKKKTNRFIVLNDAVMDAVEIYLSHSKDVSLSDFLFRSESNRGKNSGKALDRKSVERIMKDIAKACNITTRCSTHTLRKTFGYHQMMMSGNDPRKLLLLQKMFGHSSSRETLTYIGLTDEEMTEAYQHLNLGGMDYRKARIGEVAVLA